MKKDNKFFYGWLVVLGCILITATLVPPIMALSGRYTTYDISGQKQVNNNYRED